MPYISRCCCHGGKSWQESQQELKPEKYGGNLVSDLLRLKLSKLPHADKYCPEIGGMGPPTAINNQDTHSQMWPETYQMKTISQLWLISHAILAIAKWAIDANHMTPINIIVHITRVLSFNCTRDTYCAHLFVDLIVILRVSKQQT